MVTLSVCLETVFTDLPVAERIGKIAEAGFTSVEFWHPEGTWDGRQVDLAQAKDPVTLRQACRENHVTLSDFAVHAWDGSIGGCPVRAQDYERYLTQVRQMIDFANIAGCSQGITLAGVVDPALDRSAMRANLECALSTAVELAEAADFVLLLEPLNTLVDHPGYYLDSAAEGFEIVRTMNSPHLKLLYDIYHMQVMHGNVVNTIEQNLDQIGHFHAAGAPGRAELFNNELDYPVIFQRLAAAGYQGSFGLEYFPSMNDHMESLKRNRRHLLGE